MATSPVTTRLTARGRLLLGASGLVVLLSLLSLISANTALGSAQGGAARSAALSQGYESITVLPGESLWSIAREIAPDFSLSTGDIVGMIIEINNLPSSELASGQELLIPVA